MTQIFRMGLLDRMELTDLFTFVEAHIPDDNLTILEKALVFHAESLHPTLSAADLVNQSNATAVRNLKSLLQAGGPVLIPVSLCTTCTLYVALKALLAECPACLVEEHAMPFKRFRSQTLLDVNGC